MIPVIDIFAGPGGLSEGFSSVCTSNGNKIFDIALSIEMGAIECDTLRLRAFCHLFPKGKLPKEYYSFLNDPSDENLCSLKEKHPNEWKKAQKRVLQLELGEATRTEAIAAVKNAIDVDKDWILIGGPPCQAYSLVGRARRTKAISNNEESWVSDKKRTLYKEYLNIIKECKPTAFVMENVKGLLSADIAGNSVFELIRNDFVEQGYKLYSFVEEVDENSLGKDFLIQAENYGIPQRRHRIIIFGIQSKKNRKLEVLGKQSEVPLGQVLKDLPKIHPGKSNRGKDEKSEFDWDEIAESLKEALAKEPNSAVFQDITEKIEALNFNIPFSEEYSRERLSEKIKHENWYRSGLGTNVTFHQSRNHMQSDIVRYVFCALYGEVNESSPRLPDFPKELLPKHANVREDGTSKAFVDRFKVQLANIPSTTITSHLAKDGHYFIHYDPEQGRSLTVREAARAQTFPDDYYFYGERTAQYHQVGNAVPPLLAYKIAVKVAKVLGRRPKLEY